uniref:Uncharacterized protein n=1 Tax=viral metagenome TaxID=1070528 RepID=A0A6M3JUJ5_9ZZZZ
MTISDKTRTLIAQVKNQKQQTIDANNKDIADYLDKIAKIELANAVLEDEIAALVKDIPAPVLREVNV